MLGGWFVDIAEHRSAVGSETTHLAGTTRASRQGRHRGSAVTAPIGGRRPHMLTDGYGEVMDVDCDKRAL